MGGHGASLFVCSLTDSALLALRPSLSCMVAKWLYGHSTRSFKSSYFIKISPYYSFTSTLGGSTNKCNAACQDMCCSACSTWGVRSWAWTQGTCKPMFVRDTEPQLRASIYYGNLTSNRKNFSMHRCQPMSSQSCCVPIVPPPIVLRSPKFTKLAYRRKDSE